MTELDTAFKPSRKAPLWPNTTDCFFRELKIVPVHQRGPTCLSTMLAELTGRPPQAFQNGSVNTQNPQTWSDALKPFGMKLAFCPFDIREVRHYMDELVAYDDLFVIAYYSAAEGEVAFMQEPDETGYLTTSHVVLLHRDRIIDTKSGKAIPAAEHECNNLHTKGIYRVVPAGHDRGL